MQQPPRHPGRPDQVPLRNHMVLAPRVSCHYESPVGWNEAAACGVCGQLMWVNVAILAHRELRPQIPVVCCVCAELGTDVLRQAVPGTRWFEIAVDLRGGRMINVEIDIEIDRP